MARHVHIHIHRAPVRDAAPTPMEDLVERLLAAIAARKKEGAATKDEEEGHEFHGNQYTNGGGAGAKPTKAKAAGSKAGVHELLSSGHHFTLEELMEATGTTNKSTILTAISDLKNPKYAGKLGALQIGKHASGHFHVVKSDGKTPAVAAPAAAEKKEAPVHPAAPAGPRAMTDLDEGDVKKIKEAARYLKDVAYSTANLVDGDKKAMVRLSSELGKSGRGTLIMDAFNVTRDVAHSINNGLDVSQPRTLRAVDMEDAFTMFPKLRGIIDAARSNPAAPVAKSTVAGTAAVLKNAHATKQLKGSTMSYTHTGDPALGLPYGAMEHTTQEFDPASGSYKYQAHHVSGTKSELQDTRAGAAHKLAAMHLEAHAGKKAPPAPAAKHKDLGGGFTSTPSAPSAPAPAAPTEAPHAALHKVLQAASEKWHNSIPDDKLEAAAKYMHGKRGVDLLKLSHATGLSIGASGHLNKARLEHFKTQGPSKTTTSAQKIDAYLKQKWIKK